MSFSHLASGLIHGGRPRQLDCIRLLNHVPSYFWRFTDRSGVDYWHLFGHCLLPCFLCIHVLVCLEFLVRPQLCDCLFNLVTDLRVQAFRLTDKYLLKALHKFWLLGFSYGVDYFDLDDQLRDLLET